jgi:VCBS repeat protein
MQFLDPICRPTVSRWVGCFALCVVVFVGACVNPLDGPAGDIVGADGDSPAGSPLPAITGIATLINQGGGRFSTVGTPAESSTPKFAVAADLNADGLNDMVWIDLFGDQVQVMLNNGSGGLAAPIAYDVEDGPIHLRVLDLNGNGVLDIVSVNSNANTISILIGEGDGTFGEATTYPADDSPTFVATGDLDDDGDVDLISTSPIAGRLSILVNRGDGRFRTSGQVGVGRFADDIELVDLDNDGKLDVVTTNLFDAIVTVVRSADEGGFDQYAVGTWPRASITTDLNDDGFVDLVVLNMLGQSVSILINDGKGLFGEAVSYEVGADPTWFVVEDLTGDGAPDVGVSNSDDGTISVLVNQGDGSFNAANHYVVGSRPNELVTGDWDGDGLLDLAVAVTGDNAIAILTNTGQGVFRTSESIPVGIGPRTIVVTDIDGDGMDDLFVTGYHEPVVARNTVVETSPVLRTSVPAPRVWLPSYVKESYMRVGELDGLICLPEAVEWWPAIPGGIAISGVFRDQKWQNIFADRTDAGFFIQIDPYPPPRLGPLEDKLIFELQGQSFAHEPVRAAFKAEAIERVRWYRPKYLCLAMEINAYFEQQPDDFENFFSLYVETKDAIKDLYPDTMVFVSFQYEQLLGRWGGLGGQTIHDPQWDLLARFEPHSDAVAISTYPLVSLVPPRFSDPDLIPDDYYSRISDHTDLPIIFAELGWSAAERFGSSNESQADFLRRFEQLTDDMDLILVNYFFLSDTNGFGPFFNNLGLLNRNGEPRDAWDVWLSMWND